jgi:hypothetical protein
MFHRYVASICNTSSFSAAGLSPDDKVTVINSADNALQLRLTL